MSEIKPALTAEKWETFGNVERSIGIVPVGPDANAGFYAIDGWPMYNVTHHALAAIALYRQPFGFTREELELMQFLAKANNGWDVEWGGDMCTRAKSIAQKIAALLPPETK
jgi:hypothetical protein